MNMQEQFTRFFQQQFTPSGKPVRVLLAVSGGLDSVTMFHLFQQAAIETAVAHCNFQLRQSASDEDEHFVKELAATHHVPFFSKKFNTRAYMKTHKVSVQMAARELRYAWFEDLRLQNSYDFIAVAHHQDDAIETFFINIMRGTGLAGLTGIQPQNGAVIRPMLCFTRAEITSYIAENGFPYREDSSNASAGYLRNALRLDILPKLSEWAPGLSKTLLNEMRHFDEINQVFQQAVEEKMGKIVAEDPEKKIIHISKQGLRKLEPLQPYLYTWLKKFGFNSANVDDIIAGLQQNTQAQYFSNTHRLVREDEELLLISLDRKQERDSYELSANTQVLDVPVKMEVQLVDKAEVTITADKNTACFDYDRLSFPLHLRKWRNGDAFQPLGMRQHKKLSDFFTDEKFTQPEKEATWLLTSGGEIAWIVGSRLDERFKVRNDTKKVFIARLLAI